MARAACGSSKSEIIARATSFGFVPSTVTPVTPSTTASGAPPEIPATTGSSHELASR